MIMSPCQLGGSNAGSLLSKLLPESSLYVVALLVLSFAIKVSVDKGLHKREEEQAQRDSSNQAAIQEDNENTIENPALNDSMRKLQLDDGVHPPVIPIAEEKPPLQIPTRVLIVLAITWTCYLALIIGKSEVAACSDAYIGLFIVVYVPLTAGVLWGIDHAQLHHQLQLRADTESLVLPPTAPGMSLREVEGLVFFKHVYTLPIVTCVIGMVCALLGIGGGELLGPLMLSHHITPTVTSSTTATMSVLNTFALVISHLVEGDVALTTGGLLFLVGWLGGMTGRTFGLLLAIKYQKTSTIIFALAAALALSAIYFIYKLAVEGFDSSIPGLC